jgi:hypothetical protein
MNRIILNTITDGNVIIINRGGGGADKPSEGGGNAPSGGAVNFRDYDGTILHSYTKEAFLALAEMPTLPTRQGLTCQGWNYNIEDAKAYVSEYGVLEVGATYITDDGKTRLYITIAAEGRMDVPLQLQQSVSNGVVIDWGDGSATETFTGTSATTLRHTYGKIGDYIITLEVTSGTLTLKGSSSYGILADSKKVYGNMLQKVEIGNGVTSIDSYAFQICYSLASIVIPNGVTSIGSNAFNSCYSLASIVIPNSVTSIGGSAFSNCYSLASIVIPNGVTSIGSTAFNICYSLASVVIPNSVTSIGDYAFSNCSSLASIVIPNSVTSIGGYAFSNCSSLASVVIPNGVTIIGGSAFPKCYSLASVVIPNSVTSIGSNAFNSCSSVAFYDFSTHALVPSLSATNAFSSIPSDCKIVVPDALYDEWIAATNWSSYASNILKASEFNA